MAEKYRKISDMSFREAMSELEGIVGDLEGGELELEASLDKYARGVKLLSDLKKRLDSAQQKVDVLMGELEASPDDETADTTLQKA